MKFAALISGGKDSTYAILECLSLGHELVALVNLRPPVDSGADELDSYMYQSVGHEVIDAIAAAIDDVPLYRAEIKGKSVQLDLSYDFTCNSVMNDYDEVEDMFKVLKGVKTDFPDLQAVSSGAILSNYQRTRVESVCKRLDLISMAFLWNRSQEKLLRSMISSGIDAVLIKIAAIGLSEHLHLGQSIADIADDLILKSKQCGLNPCGEGGEYETITLDAPFFKQRICIKSSRTVTINDDEYAPVKYQKIGSVELIAKNDFRINQLSQCHTNLVTLADDLRIELRESIKDSSFTASANNSIPPLTVVHHMAVLDVNSGDDSVQKAYFDVIQQLDATLEYMSASKFNIVYSILCVPDMAFFSTINEVYASYFAYVNPPPRTCIQCPRNAIVLINYILPTGCDKRTMHIQSLSRWAPASIGPYSQAVELRVPSGLGYCLLLSGQIGIHPEDQQLVSVDVVYQCLMAVRHVSRVAQAHSCIGWRQLATMVCYVIRLEDVARCASTIHNVVCVAVDQCICQRVLFVLADGLPKEAAVELQAIFADIDLMSDTLPADIHGALQFTANVEEANGTIPSVLVKSIIQHSGSSVDHAFFKFQ